MTPLTIYFTAKVEKAGSSTLLSLPKSVKVGKKAVIEGVANGVPFQSAVESGGQSFKIKKALIGNVVVEIMNIGKEAETRVPKELRKSLASNPKAKALWADITPAARRDWIYWIGTAKQLTTRQRRVEGVSERLASGKRRVCCFPGVKWLMREGKK